MDLVRYIFAIVLGILSVFIILTNWSAVIFFRNKEKHFSLIPLMGGIFLCITFAIIPNNPYVNLCWIALFIDVGCLPAVIRALMHVIKSKKR